MRGTRRALAAAALLLAGAAGVDRAWNNASREAGPGEPAARGTESTPRGAASSARAIAAPGETTSGPSSTGVMARRAEAPASEEGRGSARHTAAATSAGTPSLTWPILDPVEPDDQHLTVRPTGTDPIGDRPLELFMRRGERTWRVARTRSAHDGRFSFGDIPMPDAAVELVVAVPGDAPASISGQSVARLRPAAPAFRLETNGDQWTLHLAPVVLDGQIEVIGDGDQLIALLDASRDSTLELEPTWLDQTIEVIHVLEDGRSSHPQTVYQAPRSAAQRRQANAPAIP